MKWVVRTAAGSAIAFVLLSVTVWHHHIARWPVLILCIIVAVGPYEGVDMDRFLGDDDDDEQGPLRPP